MTDTKKTRRSHKPLGEAIDSALTKLGQEFPDFSELEIAKAVQKRATQAREKAWQAERKAEHERSWAEAMATGVKRHGLHERSSQPRQESPAEREARQRQQDEYTQRLHQQERERAQERRKQFELGLEIIREGRNAIAKRMHPDVGGSKDDMSRLNREAHRLKAGA